jgi:hypothetical protein
MRELADMGLKAQPPVSSDGLLETPLDHRKALATTIQMEEVIMMFRSSGKMDSTIA